MNTFIRSTIFMAATLIALGSCSNDKTPAEATSVTETKPAVDSVKTEVVITAAQFRNADIRLGYLGEEQLSEKIKASGTLDVPPQNYAQVSTYIGGVVKSIQAQEGDYVKKGQTVIILEHPDFIKLQQEYITNKNNLLYLEKDYKRQKELAESNMGTGKILQEVESKYNATRGNVTSLENQLSMLSISTDILDKGEIIKTVALRAPIAGYLGNLNISVGAYAEPNKALYDITDNSRLVVHLNVFEKDVIRIARGQKVFVSLPNQTMQEIEGRIFSIGKTVDHDTKTVSIRAEIRDDKKILLPGMFVNAYININDNPSKVIPSDAVIRTGEKQFIFMATDPWCANPNAKNIVAKVGTPKKEMSKDSISLSYKMVEVQSTPAENGYVGITPLESINDCIVVVKGAYYLMSQLKSGETVGCCAVEEPKDVKK